MSLADFIAVEGDFADGATPAVLTPRFMRWDDRIWLLDLSACHNYWHTQARQRQTAVLTLVEDILRRSLKPGMRAVMADHPWRALLALRQMQLRDLQGLLDLQQHFGRAFYQQVSWEAWHGCAEELGTHAAACGWPRFDPVVFRRQLKHMQTVIDRIEPPHAGGQAKGATPHSWRSIDALAMRRRFGGTVALLWEWSHLQAERERPRAGTHPQGFPWVFWTSREKPLLQRHLDGPLLQWDDLALFLAEDLDRLCRLPTWDARERVTAMSWHLTLDDLSTITVPINFRHPHSLASERGQHKTALMQANYSFSATTKQKDVDVYPRGIVGWQLVIDERLVIPPFLTDLFGDSNDSDIRHLRELENQLPVPIERYELRDDWVPEAAFSRSSNAEEHPSDDRTGESCLPWLSAARVRPFYIDIPTPLDTEGYSTARIFLERVNGKWWLSSIGSSQRDYYAVIDRQQRWLWTYRDQTGKWWIHGRFD